MLRISKLTDYATVILSHMARDYSSVHAAVEVTHATGIALPTVSKILKILSKAGLVVSTRGAKGGYQLAKLPEKISVASVICALEGPIALTECGITHENCEQASNCGIRGNWDVINRAMQTALESVSLTDMIRSSSMSSFEVKIPVQAIARNHQ